MDARVPVGEQTLASYDMALGAAYAGGVPETHRQFFHRLQPFHLDDHVVCVHGGLPPGTPALVASHNLRGSALDDVLWDRSLDVPPDFAQHLGSRILVVGHTQAIRGLDGSALSGPFIQQNDEHGLLIDVDSCGTLWGLLVDDDGSWKLVESPFPREPRFTQFHPHTLGDPRVFAQERELNQISGHGRHLPHR
jgi:hypothetical protein